MVLFLICLLLVILIILCYHLSHGVTRSSSCLVNKTAIVTGANSGLGFHTALNLASRGCKVIMADVADMSQSKQNIIKYTGNTNIITKGINLASLKSVREFAADILNTEDSLHILVNNGGIASSTLYETEDGLNPTMQINYFSHFLLTHLLISLMKKSAPSRIVWTSSAAALISDLSLTSLKSKQIPIGIIPTLQIYGNSKLSMLIASDIFAQKLKTVGITSNAVHPGAILSTQNFQKFIASFENFVFRLIAYSVMLLFSKTQWHGAQVLVHVSVSKKLENSTGKFFWDCKPFFKPCRANDAKLCQDIWSATEEIVGLRSEEKI